MTFPDDPENFDPHLTTINMAQRVLENVVEGLFRLNADLEPEPLLATDYEISDDETEYTISLKEGVQFHEPIGGEMTAADVVYTFERVMDPDVGSPVRRTSRESTPSRRSTSTRCDSTSRNRSHRCSRRSRSPSRSSRGAADEVDLQEHPVGTGPFSFVDWTVNQGVEIEAFDDYHVDGVPALESVEFDIVPEPAARLTALEVGDTHLLESVPFQDIEDVSGSSETEVATQTGLFNQGYWFNGDEAPFDDARVRRAVSHAIDRDAIIQGYSSATVNRFIIRFHQPASGRTRSIRALSRPRISTTHSSCSTTRVSIRSRSKRRSRSPVLPDPVRTRRR
ncbi:ABC transporter substrate-binding protein [Natrialba swarupiae]|nr:ABC transporter substrate-binding protein [Natrialba swarupiae]